MKKNVLKVFIVALMLLALTGCKGENETVKNKKPSVKEVQIKETSIETPEEQSEEIESPTEGMQDEESSKENTTVQSAKVEESQNVAMSQSQTQTVQRDEVTSTVDPSTPETPKQSTPAVPTTPNATANDNRAVADKVLEYINSYRSAPATKLPGLTTYAEYRSRQLISNFAHDTLDERAAATALQYGTYIDPTVYGAQGEPYYAAGAREAIAKAGYTGSIDYVAKSIADLVKNSAGHWAYVGSSEYSYIAVGVTYESGMWYCDIAVARENTDNK